jgi:hypothetical protein
MTKSTFQMLVEALNKPKATPEFEQPSSPYDRNAKFVKPGITEDDYTTKLSPNDEKKFQAWVNMNQIPYDLNSKEPQDYDMRGFYKGLMTGDERATTGIDPNDGKLHFTDYWKTPYHESFSNESKFAGKNAPKWVGDKLIGPDGTIYFDDSNSQ